MVGEEKAGVGQRRRPKGTGSIQQLDEGRYRLRVFVDRPGDRPSPPGDPDRAGEEPDRGPQGAGPPPGRGGRRRALGSHGDGPHPGAGVARPRRGPGPGTEDPPRGAAVGRDSHLPGPGRRPPQGPDGPAPRRAPPGRSGRRPGRGRRGRAGGRRLRGLRLPRRQPVGQPRQLLLGRSPDARRAGNGSRPPALPPALRHHRAVDREDRHPQGGRAPRPRQPVAHPSVYAHATAERQRQAVDVLGRVLTPG